MRPERFLVVRYLAATVIACCLSCRGILGTALDCPTSMEVGDEVVLLASQVDDALEWSITSAGERLAIFVLPDGTEDTVARTVGSPGTELEFAL